MSEPVVELTPARRAYAADLIAWGRSLDTEPLLEPDWSGSIYDREVEDPFDEEVAR